jgi:Zn-dependent protease with chaperone function
MEKKKDSFTKRVGSVIGQGVATALQLAFGAVVLLFVVGSCVKDGKSFLSCVGLYHPEPVQEVEFRAIDPENEKDKRLVLSLIRMAQAADMDVDQLRVAIAVTPHINAMTIGTDTFVLCEGLEKLSDEALDAVMAHEIAHAAKDHSGRSSELLNTVDKVTRIAGALAGADEETRDEVSSWAIDVAFAPYSQGQELEADSMAVELLKEAGYPLDAVEVMCAALDFIAQEEGEVGGGFLSTHPSIPDRIAALRQQPQNVTGPLSKTQYWPALIRIMQTTNPHWENLQGLQDRVDVIGAQAALNELALDVDSQVLAGESFISTVSMITPPAEYAPMHSQMIMFWKDLQSALAKQAAAVKKGDIKLALAAQSEAADVMLRNEDLFQLLESEIERLSAAEDKPKP